MADPIIIEIPRAPATANDLRRKYRNPHVYKAYRAGLMRMVREGWGRGIPVVSVTPFVGLTEVEEQFATLERMKLKGK